MRDDDPELVAIASYSSRIEAEIAASQLRAEDLESIVIGPDAGGTFQAVPGGIRLLVHATDADRATEILESAASRAAPREPRPMPFLNKVLLFGAVIVLAAVLIQVFRVTAGGG
jgi:hypothetical protein